MSTPDWDAVANEATDILRRYLQINTINPPGNEERATEFLAQLLAKDGIESRTLTSAPGRANLVAELPGETDAKPLVLLNHTDVVPVEAHQWQVDPFAGVLKDGYIWGRGALDMKGMGVLELMTMRLLKRRDPRCSRP